MLVEIDYVEHPNLGGEQCVRFPGRLPGVRLLRGRAALDFLIGKTIANAWFDGQTVVLDLRNGDPAGSQTDNSSQTKEHKSP